MISQADVHPRILPLKNQGVLTFPKYFVFQKMSLYLTTKLNVVNQNKHL